MSPLKTSLLSLQSKLFILKRYNQSFEKYCLLIFDFTTESWRSGKWNYQRHNIFEFLCRWVNLVSDLGKTRKKKSWNSLKISSILKQIGPQQQRQPGTNGTGCSFFFPVDNTSCPTQPRVTVSNIVLKDIQLYNGATLPGSKHLNFTSIHFMQQKKKKVSCCVIRKIPVRISNLKM